MSHQVKLYMISGQTRAAHAHKHAHTHTHVHYNETKAYFNPLAGSVTCNNVTMSWSFDKFFSSSTNLMQYVNNLSYTFHNDIVLLYNEITIYNLHIYNIFLYIYIIHKYEYDNVISRAIDYTKYGKYDNRQ